MSANQRANTISTTILKAKALVVIKGKNNEEETRNGMNGMKKSPASTALLNVCLFIGTIVTWSQYMKKIRQKAYSALRNTEHMFKTDMVYLSKSSFWTTLRFVIGTVASIGTMIAFGNLLPKETYGLYSYLMSLAGSLGFLTLTGASSGVLRATARGQGNILPYATKLQLRYSTLATLTIAGGAFYYWVNGNNVFALSLFILSITLPLASVYHIYEAVLIGRKRFDTLTIISGISTLIASGSTILALFFTQNILFLLTIYAFFSLAPNIFAYLYVKRDISTENPSPDSIADLRKTSFHLTGASLIGVFAQQIDKIILFQVAGPAALAIYGFAMAGPERLKGLVKNWAVAALPILAVKSVNDVRHMFYKRIFFTLILGIILSTFYILLSPILFHWFLPNYYDAIIYSQIYSLSLIVIPAGVYIGQVLVGQNMLRAVYAYSIGSQTLRILLFVALGWKWQIWGLIIASIAYYTASMIYSIIVWEIETRRLVKKQLNNL